MNLKMISLGLMVILYLLAGVNHFLNPGFYIEMMPPWFPSHAEIVFLTGILEILFAVFLLPVSTRTYTVYLLIIFLVCIFPANIQMSLNFYHDNNPQFWASLVRLPFQPLLIIWAWSHRR